MNSVPRLVLSLCALSLLFTTTGCEERFGNPGGDGPARLEVIGGDTVDWGEVGAGELTHTLKIVNTGGDTLRIGEVKPSCGCTTAPLDKEVLNPGDTAMIALTMDVAERNGFTTKTVSISSNDSAMPVRTVTLMANVIQEIQADPKYFAISGIRAGEQGTAGITLWNRSTTPITIQPPKPAETPLMDVKFDMAGSVTLQPGDSLRVNVMATPLNPSPTPVAYFFETDSKKTPKVKVTLNISTVAEENGTSISG